MFVPLKKNNGKIFDNDTKKKKKMYRKSNFISLIQNFSFYILDWSKNLTFQNVQVRVYVIYYAFVIFFFSCVVSIFMIMLVKKNT